MKCTVGHAHVRAGHGTGRDHAAEEDSGEHRLYCDFELHLGLEMIWRMGCESGKGKKTSRKRCLCDLEGPRRASSEVKVGGRAGGNMGVGV